MPSASVIRFRRAAMLVAAVTPWASVAVLAADGVTPSRSHLVPVSEAARTPSPATGLGMTLSRASPVLRRQLALTRGAGLVVDTVAPGSPAARAGFEPHDVVVRLDDQILVLPEQLDALLEWAEPEDLLACTVLRGGRSVSISLAGKIARQAPQARGLRPTASSLALVKPPQPGPDRAGRLHRLTDETLLREDGDFRIQLTRGDETRLTVSDLTGQIVFDGGIDTAAGQARIPTVIRDRVVAMMQSLEPRPAGQSQLAGTDPASAPTTPPSRGPERIGQLDLPAIELR